MTPADKIRAYLEMLKPSASWTPTLAEAKLTRAVEHLLFASELSLGSTCEDTQLHAHLKQAMMCICVCVAFCVFMWGIT